MEPPLIGDVFITKFPPMFKIAVPYRPTVECIDAVGTLNVKLPTILVVDPVDKTKLLAPLDGFGKVTAPKVRFAVLLFVTVLVEATVRVPPKVILLDPLKVGLDVSVTPPVPKLIVPAPLLAVTPAPIFIVMGFVPVVKLIEPPEFTVTRPVNVFAEDPEEFTIAPVTERVLAKVIATPPASVVVPEFTSTLPKV